MRIAVLSDVHGNCFALETVAADVKNKGLDSIVCNGDMIQSGPQPHETVQLLRDMKCPIVLGNSAAWLLTGVETDAHLISEERRKKLDTVRDWSLNQLTGEDRAFINSFQSTVTIELGHGRTLLAFHGSPTSFDQVLLPSTPEDEFQDILKRGSMPTPCDRPGGGLLPGGNPAMWDAVLADRDKFQAWDPADALFVDAINDIETNIAQVVAYLEKSQKP